MAKIEEVAQRAGVSPITVSRVMRNHPNVREETRQRVRQAVSDLHYVPNAVARGLKQARTGLVALVVTDMLDSFFTDITRGVEDALRRAGLMMVLGNSDDDLAMEIEYLRVMGEHRVDGIILVPTPRPPDFGLPPLPRSIPLVLVDHSLPGVAADVVRCDTASGVRQLCQHLISLGHRRIAIAGGLPETLTWQERVVGYRQAMQEAEIVVPAHFVVDGNYRADGGAAAVRELMARAERPDAIIAAGTKVAVGVLDELVGRGFRIPGDIAVAAVDDPFPKSKFSPRLTGVEQPGFDMGQKAVELLLSRLPPVSSDASPREVVFDTTFRAGETCGELLSMADSLAAEQA